MRPMRFTFANEARRLALLHGIPALGLAVAVLTPAHARLEAPGSAGKAAAAHARGTFDVKLTPQALAADAGDALGRMSIAKQFHGDLEGTSAGEMLTAGSAAAGSAGYVAMEKVTGLLAGRRGTFVLQHSGTMDNGAQSLTVSVVPGSATGDLAGLSGRMAIDVGGGRHGYDFEYVLPDVKR